jgi:diadenosine tetraphosphate (Ap4A) HIT family hydrolase
VYETDEVLAFLDIGPLSEGHLLVIPKFHAQRTHELPPKFAAAVGAALAVVGKALVSHTGVQDYNILNTNGAIAHQEVMHVHFHIIPKPSSAQGLGVKWSSTHTADKDAMASFAASVRGLTGQTDTAN